MASSVAGCGGCAGLEFQHHVPHRAMHCTCTDSYISSSPWLSPQTCLQKQSKNSTGRCGTTETNVIEHTQMHARMHTHTNPQAVCESRVHAHSTARHACIRRGQLRRVAYMFTSTNCKHEGKKLRRKVGKDPRPHSSPPAIHSYLSSSLSTPSTSSQCLAQALPFPPHSGLGCEMSQIGERELNSAKRHSLPS